MRRRGRKRQVIDTNVMIVANGREGGSRECARNCTRALLGMKHFGTLVIDDGDRILSEYRAHCSLAGQPGMGDSFIRWIHDNRGRGELVQVVGLSQRQDGGFVEFPEHPDLAEFDPGDRKFVAVANAHHDKPPILQASDTKWWGWKEALQSCGITVEFLCPEQIQAAFERKFNVD